jgi:hypothetical protein
MQVGAVKEDFEKMHADCPPHCMQVGAVKEDFEKMHADCPPHCMQVGAVKEDFEKMQLDWRDVSTRYFASVQPNGTHARTHARTHAPCRAHPDCSGWPLIAPLIATDDSAVPSTP